MPTAVHAPGEMHDTESSMPAPWWGVGSSDHFEPFQRSANGNVESGVRTLPTATQSRVEGQDTATSWLPWGLVIRWSDQLEPFQRSAKLRCGRSPTAPTAMQSPVGSQDTPVSRAFAPTGVGIRWTDHPDAAAAGALTSHDASITDAAARQVTLRNNRRFENIDLRSAATILDRQVHSALPNPVRDARSRPDRGQAT